MIIKTIKYLLSKYLNELNLHRLIFFISALGVVDEWQTVSKSTITLPFQYEMLVAFFIFHSTSLILTFTNIFFKKNSLYLIYFLTFVSTLGLSFTLYHNNYEISYAFKNLVIIFAFSLLFRKLIPLYLYLGFAFAINVVVLLLLENPATNLKEYVWMIGAISIISLLNSKLKFKALQKALNNDLKLQALFKNTNDGVSIVNEFGIVKFQSESLIRILGLEAWELMDKSIFDVIYHEDKVYAINEFTDLLDKYGEQKTITIRAVHKNGEIKTIECIGKNLLKDEVINGIVINARDITERILQSEENLELKNQFQSVMANSFDSILIFEPVYDSDGLIFNFNCTINNQSSNKLFKNYSGNISGSLLTDLFKFINQKNDLLEDFLKVAEYKSGINKEIYLETNTLRGWYYIAITPLIKGISITIADITERKQTEYRLKESEKQYKTLFQLNPKPMWVYNRNNYKFIEVNAAAIKHYGYSHEEFMKMNLMDIRPEEDREKLITFINNNYKTETLNTPTLWKHLKKNGEEIYVEIHRTHIKVGEIEANLAIIEDFTEKFESERKKEKADYIIRKQNTDLLKVDLRHITNQEDFELKLKDILKLVADVLDVSRISLWYFIEENTILRSKISYLADEEVFDEQISEISTSDYPIYINSFTNERALIVNNLFKDPRTIELVNHFGKELNISSLIDQPFRIKNNIAGILCIEHVGAAREWITEEINFALTISELISKTFESLERAKAENQLHLNELKYRSLFSTSKDAIVVYSAATAEFIDANQAWTDLTGYTLEETKKLKVFDVSAEKDLSVDTYKEVYTDILKDKNITFIKNKFNKIIPAEISGNEFLLDGTLVNFSVLRNMYDIIETEKQIKDSKNKFELLFSKSKDAIIIYNKTGVIVDCNESALDLFQLSKNEIIGKDSTELAPEYQPDGISSVDKSKQLFQENTTMESKIFQCQYLKSTNEAFLAEVTMSFFSHDGEKFAQAFIRDITEKIKAEAYIKESELKYRTLIENMQDGMFLIQDGYLNFVNQSFAKMVNFTIEECIGKHFSEFVFEEDLPMVADSYNRRLAGEQVENEYGFRLKVHNQEEPLEVNMTVSLINYENKLTSIGILKNISESKKSQELIKLTEQRFLSFMNNSPILAWIKDENLNYTFMNIAFKEAFNIKDFEPGKMSDYDIMPLKHAEEYRANDLIAIHESKVFRTNEYSREHTGSQKVSIVYKFPIKMLNATFVGGIAIDITDKVNAEKAVRMVNAELQAIFDAFPDLFFRIKNDTTVIDYKAGKDSKLYIDMPDFLGKKLTELMPDVISNKLTESINELLKTEQTQTFEYELNITNEDRSYEARLVKFNRSEILIIVRDISELKEKELALAENEEKLNNILNSLQNIVWSYDINNDKLIYVNPAAEAVYGIPVDEMYASEGQFWYQLLHPDDVEAVKKMYQEVFKAKVAVLEYRIFRNQTELRWIRERATLIMDKNGLPIRMDGIAVDITEEKKTQELTKAKELAEQSATMKQQFLANMSHEIRTPMNGIMGVTEMLMKTKLNNQQNELVEIIKNSADNLMVILNDVLDLSKMEAGKMELKNIVFNIHHTSKKIKGLFNPLALKKNLDFNIIYDNNLPDYVSADESRIMQMLANLTGNAIKFTDQGSVNIKFNLDKAVGDNLLIKVSVEDTGIGIQEEDIEKLFETFSQIDFENSRKFTGTGLGLSIVKKLAEMMGGTVGVESEYGKGSTFWFTFLANKVDSSEIEKSIHKTTDTDMSNITFNLSILLVEDKVINQKVAGMMLENLGCKVEIAGNGKEALAMFKEGKYDLILMDIQMPIMDGVEATKTLRKVYSNICRIIGLSANSLEGDAEKYISIGMDDYISKPITLQKLVEKLSKFFPYENKGSFEDKIKNTPIRDERQLASISTEKEVIAQLNNTFLKDLEEINPQLMKALETGNYSFIEETTHGIKGIAANIGALRIYEITSKINSDLKSNNTSECSNLLDLLIEETEVFSKEIKNNLNF
jgi:PAS domain S-box-containing protein